MTGPDRADPAAPTDDDAEELITQLRELAGADPADVRQVVAEVLAALDRAAGGALREHLPETIRVDAGLDAGVPGPAVTPGHGRSAGLLPTS